MTAANLKKSTVAEIKERFDKDVERFSNLETGQQSTIDAPLSLELITEAAKAVNPKATHLLDIGCGAGNYTLKMLSKLPSLHCTLIDLSQPMLIKANERVSAATSGKVETIQGDIREIALPDNQYDIILAGAVLHHLREEKEWEAVFTTFHRALKAGGSLWISDLIVHDTAAISSIVGEKYGSYLKELGGEAYQKNVFAYIEKEDTPRSLNYQLDLLKQVGFANVEVLHKHLCFAAFGGIKQA